MDGGGEEERKADTPLLSGENSGVKKGEGEKEADIEGMAPGKLPGHQDAREIVVKGFKGAVDELHREERSVVVGKVCGVEVAEERKERGRRRAGVQEVATPRKNNRPAAARAAGFSDIFTSRGEC